MAHLRAADGITAALVGFVHTPSPEFVIYKAVVRQGDLAKFEEMVRDQDPVVRCIGLLALAETEGKESVATLRRHLSDDAEITYQAFDMVESTTIGQFALQLLQSPDYLCIHDPNDRVPLLSRKEFIALYLETLVDDATINVHESVATALPIILRRQRMTIDLPTLTQCAPSLADWQIVKAIGRLRALKTTQPFLLACVEDSNTPPDVRFAATSALTRRTDRASSRAIRVYREPLNRLDDGRWGDHFVEILNARRAHEKYMRLIGRRGSQRFRPSKKKYIRRILATAHPLALEDILELSISDEMHAEWADCLIAISLKLDRFSQPWSTYTDTAFKIDQYLRHLRFVQHLFKKELREGQTVPQWYTPFTEAQRAEIERNISRITGDR